jgi:hypothetical protein
VDDDVKFTPHDVAAYSFVDEGVTVSEVVCESDVKSAPFCGLTGVESTSVCTE